MLIFEDNIYTPIYTFNIYVLSSKYIKVQTFQTIKILILYTNTFKILLLVEEL